MNQYTITEYNIEDYDNVKENMTNEEAILLIKRVERGWIPDYNYTGKEHDFENYKLHVALIKAIDAINSL